MDLKQRYIFLLLCILATACTTKTEQKPPKIATQNIPNTVTDRTKPDPNIAVKDDYTSLTKEDEEREDKTHMDMSYYPSNYALDKAQQKPVQLIARVTYSRPHKRDRTIIFGDSTAPVPYGKLWRLGANESTEVEFLRPVIINNKTINVGRYTLFAIPNKSTWRILLNSALFTWGDFNYDPKNDIVKVDVPVKATSFSLETFLIYFQKTTTGCNMIMSWDTVLVALPIVIKN